jgi:DNA-binding MarR family transcriptional regulator
MSSDATIRPHREEIVRLLCAYAAESLRVTDTWAAAHGITGTDVRAMAHLGDARPGGMPVTAGRLGTALGLSSPATSALIARLESGGHVTRARDPKDRRRVLLTASPSAKRGAAAYFQPMGNAVTAALAECSEDETAVIATFLERLVKEMHLASRA